MLRDGVGVEPDIDKAKVWLELGASRGDYWGALDRGRIELDQSHDGVEASKWLALAAALNVNRGNNDPDQQAAHLLATISQADKQAALSQLQSKVGAAQGAKTRKSNLDAELVKTSDDIWRKSRPRFDLF